MRKYNVHVFCYDSEYLVTFKGLSLAEVERFLGNLEMENVNKLAVLLDA